jgi:hypothetical protein
MGWVTKILSSRAPPCFGRHVNHLQSLAPTNPHWARVVDYGPFSLWVIHKEGLCPSSGDINRLAMMIFGLIIIVIFLGTRETVKQVTSSCARTVENYLKKNSKKTYARAGTSWPRCRVDTDCKLSVTMTMTCAANGVQKMLNDVQLDVPHFSYDDHWRGRVSGHSSINENNKNVRN